MMGEAWQQAASGGKNLGVTASTANTHRKSKPEVGIEDRNSRSPRPFPRARVDLCNGVSLCGTFPIQATTPSHRLMLGVTLHFSQVLLAAVSSHHPPF